MHDSQPIGYLDWLYIEFDFKKWFTAYFHVNRDFGDFMILFDDVVTI